jgi:hypothetical protein
MDGKTGFDLSQGDRKSSEIFSPVLITTFVKSRSIYRSYLVIRGEI